MRLQESGEMYLEAIYVLSKNQKFVRSIRILKFIRSDGILGAGIIFPYRRQIQ